MKRTLLFAAMAMLIITGCQKAAVTHTYCCSYAKQWIYLQHTCKDSILESHSDTMKKYTDHEINALVDKNNTSVFDYVYVNGTCDTFGPGTDRQQTKVSMTCIKVDGM